MNLTFEESVICVVGVAKNCGKTTTLNYLVSAARAAGRTIGLVSVGIDGESTDVLIGSAKPPIGVVPGQLVASSRTALQRSSADVEYLRSLEFSTPMGEAVIGRVASEGEVVLAGMRHRDDVKLAVTAMREAGADQVWIDGAYGRIVSAQPGLAEGVVVATGAVISSRIKTIVARTASLVDRLSLPAIELDWQTALMQAALADDRALLGGPNIEPIELPARSALLGLSKGRDRWTPQVEAVAVPGLVSDRVVQELTRRSGTGTLLIPDGTVLQADDRLASALARRWEIRVLRKSRVIAIAYNPTSLRGPAVHGEHLRQALAARYEKIPIFDPVVGLQ